MVSVQPWSTAARRCVPSIRGGFIICWVDRGVRNQRDVVIVWGREGRGFCVLNFAKRNPAALPRRRAIIGPAAE